MNRLAFLQYIAFYIGVLPITVNAESHSAVVQCPSGIWQEPPCIQGRSKEKTLSVISKQELTRKVRTIEEVREKLAEEVTFLQQQTSLFPVELIEAQEFCNLEGQQVIKCLQKIVQSEKVFFTRVKTLTSSNKTSSLLSLEEEKVRISKKRLELDQRKLERDPQPRKNRRATKKTIK